MHGPLCRQSCFPTARSWPKAWVRLLLLSLSIYLSLSLSLLSIFFYSPSPKTYLTTSKPPPIFCTTCNSLPPGAYNAYRKFFKSWLPADCDVVCVGDGTTPRTAGLFAFLSRDRSRKRFFSIDPILNGGRFVLDNNTLQHMQGNKSPGASVGLRIQNLVCLSKSVYDVTPEGLFVSEDRWACIESNRP